MNKKREYVEIVKIKYYRILLYPFFLINDIVLGLSICIFFILFATIPFLNEVLAEEWDYKPFTKMDDTIEKWKKRTIYYVKKVKP